MKPTQTGSDGSDRPVEDDKNASLNPRTAGERWTIRVLLLLVVVLIVAGVAQTIGRDLTLAIRRLPIFRQVAAAPLPLVSTRPAVTASAETTGHVSGLVRVSGADAQIVPPRSRRNRADNSEIPNRDANAANQEPDAAGQILPAPAADFSADALEVANRDKMSFDSNTPQRAATSDSSDLTDTLLETAAQLVSLSWQDFAYPADWRAAETSKARMVYNNHRNRLMKSTAHARPSSLSLAQARKDYAAARAQFDDDPRLEYAFGLVLWKHEQFAEAIDVFQSAARLEETPFLPAALAVAWGRFLIHEERRGLDQLAHVARLLGTSQGDYPTAEQKEQAAILIGRAFGYLAASNQNPALTETIELTSKNIDERLPESLRASFESGRQDFGSRQSELLRLAYVPVDQAKSDHQKRTDELQCRIDTLRGEMRDARNVTTREHLTHVDTVKNILLDVLDVRAQMEQMQPMVRQLKDDAMNLSRPKGRLDVKTIFSHYEMVPINPYVSIPLPRYMKVRTLLGETASDRANRISQLNRVRDELKRIDEELDELRDRQRSLVAERHAAEEQQKEETDEARRLRVARKREQQELENKLTELNKSLRRVLTLHEGVDTIAAYVPWNVEVEGEALWRALTSSSRIRSK